MTQIKRSPSTHAFLNKSNRSYVEGAVHFQTLLKRLGAIAPDFADLRVFTSADDGPNGAGLNPLTEMDAIVEFNRGQGFDNPDGHSAMRISAETWRDGAYGRKMLSYTWNGSGNDELSIKLDYPTLSPAITLDRFVAIADVILSWQPTRYLWCADRQYWSRNLQLFAPNRLPIGWFCWIPKVINQQDTPSAWRVAALQNGSVIVTQPQFFNIGNNTEAIKQANAVEFELNELGELPLHASLL